MKQRLQKIGKVFLIMVLLISTGYTGFFGANKLDVASTAEASSDVWTYNFTATYQGTSVQPIVDDSKLSSYPRGGKGSFVIDFSSNTFTVDKLHWALGYPSPTYNNYGVDNNTYFANAWEMNTISAYGGAMNYTESHYSNKYFKEKVNSLNITGANYFKNQVVVGATIPFTSFYNELYKGNPAGHATNGYITINSISKGSSGGSCGQPTSTDVWTYNFTAVTERTTGTSNPLTDPNGFASFQLNEQSTFVIDFTDNSFKTKVLHWAFGHRSPDLEGYSTNNTTFFNNAGSMNTILNYNTSYSDLYYVNRYFNTEVNSLNIYGASFFKTQLVVGSTIPFTTFYTYTKNGKPYANPTYGHIRINSITKGGGSSTPCAPAEITCPVGTTKKGSGTSAYCEKIVTNNVKQTEYQNPNFIKDIDLNKLISNMGEFGSSGERGDGQFNLDSGNHNNGWYLNGSGDSYKSTHVQFTNVPDNGYVNAIGNTWSPEYQITQGKNKIAVPVPSDATTVEKQKRDTDLSNFKSTGSLSEVIAYQVTDLNALKAMQETDKGLTDLFTKTGSTYKYGTNIVSHKVDQTGEGNYNDFKLNEGGYYILASKYTDMVGAKKESTSPNQTVIDKYTYYSFIPVSVNFMTNLSYLPVYNNLLTQVNDKMLMTGNQKANHKLANLKYGSYNSLKVPSAYNHVKGNTIIGSTSGGIQLLNRELNTVTITGETSIATTAKVTDIVEYGNGFYIASDQGILYLNCNNNSLSKTSITEPVNDLEMNFDSLYYLTDNKLGILFADGSNLIESTNEYDLSTMFNNPATKAGRVELLNGLLTVSSKDDSSLSEVITLTK